MNVVKHSVYSVVTKDEDKLIQLESRQDKIVLNVFNNEHGMFAGGLDMHLEITPEIAFQLGPVLQALAREAGYKTQDEINKIYPYD